MAAFDLRSEAATPSSADALREINLVDLVGWHGLPVRREGVSVRVKTDRHNIVITGNKWFDNKAGLGGLGAIDLQMHLGRQDFSAACDALANEFHVMPTAHSPAADLLAGSSDPERLPFPQLMAKYAAKDDDNWPIARVYLVETRKIEPRIVDELHDRGSIYANNHRPNPALVFLHRTSCGKVTGATLRDTRHQSTFRPTLGNKLSAWFAVGNIREAHSVVAVESPIDALSYHSLFASRNDSLAVVSCSGSVVPEELLFQAYDRRQRFVVALDNDPAGLRGWQKAWDDTADWSGFNISSECPQLKDWNADVIASHQAVRIAQSLKHKSPHL